ncbi:RNA ligase family protein [Chitinophaga sp.]|uniref:RNA ligase family protein n=1 Tax=Chitinophaga sp. TaxID=1869181 RepID=UPI00260FD6F8|nr:RNA ligase family protein [uncultured Chitinophaga sp.]
MAISTKYGRTYHFPFSPGTSSDDRINYDYWDQLSAIPKLVHTEKLDGENNCLSRLGVFARSHAAPTTSPWTEDLRRFWQMVKHDLGPLEIFLENLYAIHSLEYRQLDHHYYVFAVREDGRWLSWEETRFYAHMLDLPVVPEVSMPEVNNRAAFEKELVAAAGGSGAFGPHNAASGAPATMEGIVTRNADGYPADEFSKNVFKYVRKGHVQTDVHWTRNWKRARLKQEGGNYVDHQY